MKEKSKKVIIAIELVGLIILSTFVISIILTDAPLKVKNQLPDTSISANVKSGEAPLEVSFKGLCIDNDGTIDSYFWDFGDGSTSDLRNPKHIFQKEGEYIVYFTATDNYGGTGSDTLAIRVFEDKTLKADAYATPQIGRAPLRIRFTAKAEGGVPPYSYNWVFTGYFIGERKSNKQDVYLIYYTEGWAIGHLTVTDSTGATAKDMVRVYVNPSIRLLIRAGGALVKLISTNFF